MDIDKLEDLGEDITMNEYIKEAEEVSFEGEMGESYDKEWALKDQEIEEIAKNMLLKNMEINLIVELTGLTEKEIKSL